HNTPNMAARSSPTSTPSPDSIVSAFLSGSESDLKTLMETHHTIVEKKKSIRYRPDEFDGKPWCDGKEENWDIMVNVAEKDCLDLKEPKLFSKPAVPCQKRWSLKG